MKERQKRAEELHIKGYNCAQTVVCLFPEVFPDIRQAFKMSEPFGFGMESHRTVIMNGMDPILPALWQDKLWEMIWERWNYYEDFCNKR